MTFVSESADYSQVGLVKEILGEILEKYNEYIIKDIGDIENKKYIVPNNNNKYYCFCIDKKEIEKSGGNYSLLYFFNNYDNFFTEIEFVSDMNKVIFEGYMYKKDDTCKYLMTDIIWKDGVVNLDYETRYNYICRMIKKNLLKNYVIDIQPHQVFKEEGKGLVEILRKNFKYSSYNELSWVETISNHKKLNKMIEVPTIDITEIKLLKKQKLPDIYKVYSIKTGVNEGVLYVGSLKTSKILKEEFKDKVEKEMTCKWNKTFGKWEVVN